MSKRKFDGMKDRRVKRIARMTRFRLGLRGFLEQIQWRRLALERGGKRVRLVTQRGYERSDRYSLIGRAAAPECAGALVPVVSIPLGFEQMLTR